MRAWRRVLGPAVATGAMLPLLLGLGVWQVRRLAWKEGLLAQIAAAAAAAPVALPRAPDAFQRAWVEGRLDGGRQVRFGAEVRDTPRGPLLGEQVIVPLDRAGAAPVLVDLGWVPEHARAAVPAGVVRVTGFVRAAERPGWLSATDDPREHRFYTLEPGAMAASVGVSGAAPFTLVAAAAPVPVGRALGSGGASGAGAGVVAGDVSAGTGAGMEAGRAGATAGAGAGAGTGTGANGAGAGAGVGTRAGGTGARMGADAMANGAGAAASAGVAGSGAEEAVAPVPVGAPLEPPNNHLSYALTWFGLAGVLLAVFGVWTRRALLDAPGAAGVRPELR